MVPAQRPMRRVPTSLDRLGRKGLAVPVVGIHSYRQPYLLGGGTRLGWGPQDVCERYLCGYLWLCRRRAAPSVVLSQFTTLLDVGAWSAGCRSAFRGAIRARPGTGGGVPVVSASAVYARALRAAWGRESPPGSGLRSPSTRLSAHGSRNSMRPRMRPLRFSLAGRVRHRSMKRSPAGLVPRFRVRVGRCSMLLRSRCPTAVIRYQGDPYRWSACAALAEASILACGISVSDISLASLSPSAPRRGR